MKVRRVRIHRRPGISQPFGVELGPGLNVLQGTNGSGKTSLCRTVFEVLWSERGFRGAAEVELESGGRVLVASREGGEDTEWSGGRPQLPDASQRRTYFLGIDDLFDAHGDEELATAVRRELGRGFDLATPLLDERRLTGSSQQVHAARRELQSAVEAHREVAQAQERLDVEAGELRERREEVAQVRAAERELATVEQALDTLRADRRARTLRDGLAELPSGVERVHPRADRDLDERETAVVRAREALEAAELRLQTEEVRAEETGLPGEGLSDAELSALERACRALEVARERRDRAAGALAGASERLSALSGEGLPESAPSHADVRGLEDGLRAVREAELRVSEQQAYVEAMTGEEGDELAPRVVHAQRLTVGLLVLGALGIVTGALLAQTGAAAVLLLVFGTLSLGLALLLGRPLAQLRGVTSERDVLRRAAERRLARDERLAGEARDAQVARLEGLGLDPTWGGFELTALEGRLAARREAQTLQAEMRAALEECDEQELAARRSLARVVDPLREALSLGGEVPRGALSEDAAALLLSAERLRGREAKRRQAAESIPELEGRCAVARRTLEEAERARTRFFAENGLADGDVVGLRERLRARPRWQELSDQLRDAERRAAEGHEVLGDDTDEHAARLLEQPLDELEGRAEDLRTTRDRRDELVREVAALETRLEQTARGSELAEARSVERAARERLGGLRDDALLGAAADVLLADVEEEHRREVRDGVVPRASRAFARFTDGEYTLEAPLAASEPEAEAALGCVVRSSETKRLVSPSALSNGTRAQLLLALRVALAEELEGPEPLPMFLDEVLATSDPRRLEAVTKSLAELVLGGRQVVLLTADPVVAARVVDALGTSADLLQVVDVDAARNRDSLVLTAKDLVAAPERSDPDPAAFDGPESYAEALGVPAVDPFLPATALHPFHLLRDALPVVRTLRSHHLDSTGRALQAVDDNLPHGLADGTARSLRRRVALAQAFLEAWRVGRTPKLSAELLRGSALRRSERFLEPAVAIAEELDWDAAALVEALMTRADERLKGFRVALAEELRVELEAAGYWTAHGPLEGEALQRDALERAAGLGLDVDPRELERLGSWLRSGLT